MGVVEALGPRVVDTKPTTATASGRSRAGVRLMAETSLARRSSVWSAMAEAWIDCGEFQVRYDADGDEVERRPSTR